MSPDDGELIIITQTFSSFIIAGIGTNKPTAQQ